jgi:AcrR family transcriptional regulator
MVAERARVTPSTIYRRWGDLRQPLADVALERLRPIADPDDTGSTASDLDAYILQSAEEVSSGIGRLVLRDVLAEQGGAAAAKFCRYTREHLTIIAARAVARGEPPFDVAEIIDRVWGADRLPHPVPRPRRDPRLLPLAARRAGSPASSTAA